MDRNRAVYEGEKYDDIVKRDSISLVLYQLRIKQEKLGIEEYEYNLGDKPIRELEIGIMSESNLWKFYQSLERGKVNIIDTFDNEYDACVLLLKYLVMRKNRKDRKK